MLYTLYSCAIIFSLLLIKFSNPIYSLLCLIGVFLCGSILVLFSGLSFIPFLCIIVCVGAIAILFIFIIIILDLKGKPKYPSTYQLQLILLFTLLYLFSVEWAHTSYILIQEPGLAWQTKVGDLSNPFLLGYVVFREFWIHVLLIGLILLVALIGGVALIANRGNRGQNLQQSFRQVSRYQFHS